MARESKSQTVRLKEEILHALSVFTRESGSTQQHAVSVGAWFYMCMPSNLRHGLTTAFYEWCKDKYGAASIPRESPEFVRRVVKAIEDECNKEEAKFATSPEEEKAWMDTMMGAEPDLAATPDEAAEQALDGAAKKLGVDRKKAPRKRGPGRGKGRKSG